MSIVPVTFQLSVPATFLPKATVVQHPFGSPTISYHPVSIPVLGLRSGDGANSFSTSPQGLAGLVAVNNDELIVQNGSYQTDAVISGSFNVVRHTETFNIIETTTDADGYAVIAHNLYSNPVKWLISAAVSSDQSPVTINFVSSDDTVIRLRAFVGTEPLANSTVKFSLSLFLS